MSIRYWFWRLVGKRRRAGALLGWSKPRKSRVGQPPTQADAAAVVNSADAVISPNNGATK